MKTYVNSLCQDPQENSIMKRKMVRNFGELLFSIMTGKKSNYKENKTKKKEKNKEKNKVSSSKKMKIKNSKKKREHP